VKVVFLAQAESELDDAVVCYNRQAVDLGRELLDELDRAIRRAATFRYRIPRSNPASGVAA
jgi:plasmid stabilization system protein ParE